MAKAGARERDASSVAAPARIGPSGADTDGERAELIAAAAARCFARWGVGRTRMEDIAREVGIARPVLYRHYASKDALVLEVMVRHINERAADLHRRMKPRGPAGPLITEALRIGISGGEDRALTQSMLEEDALRTTARLVAESDDVFRAMSAYWRPYLEYARERGELRPEVDIDQAVRWLTFLVMHFLTVPETVPPLDELPVYLKTFVVNAIVA